MDSVLFLVHRLPYPPNKGDKVRSYHLLRHLAQHHRVFLGTFVDDAADLAHVDTVRALCAGLHVERLYPALARAKSLVGLSTGEPLSVPYYRNAGLQAWVDRTLAAERIRSAVLFSSPMVQYVAHRPGLRRLIDFVDVDSAKWAEYAASRPWPLSRLYARESARLLAYETQAAMHAERSFFVTDAEVDLFRRLAPSAGARVERIGNGVDAAYFTPEKELASPFRAGEVPVVFVGAMDYWPNVDAACWFVQAVLPELRRRNAAVRFYIVGMRPAPAVRALAGEAVVVTGTVPDVRPYVRHGATVVAPLRIARGIQNKILEAMAMGKAVIASDTCAASIEARNGIELLTATLAQDFAASVDLLLRNPDRARAMGTAARACVLAKYSWGAELGRLERHLAPEARPEAVPA
ncbi:MAG: TIGR03087 family PEP-CTERM/XrtA system glycosyltransferase [Burkholderiales bacterium]|nr:TIGR03087 family PEP-CTERM/XrtA system glycosyltransferase [Burkholderiales bacterium]